MPPLARKKGINPLLPLPSYNATLHEDYDKLFEEAHLAQLHGKGGVCEQIINKLHVATELLETRYKDVNEEGGRSLALCGHM